MDGKIAAYRHADTMGKSQLELILMVYDGALKSLQAAVEHYTEGDTQPGYEELQKAKRFVTHLYSTLDSEKGGEVAENLGKMYVWIITQLSVIEATKDVEQLEAVVTVLRNLRSGWADLKKQQTPAPSVPSVDAESQVAGAESVDKLVTTA